MFYLNTKFFLKKEKSFEVNYCVHKKSTQIKKKNEDLERWPSS